MPSNLCATYSSTTGRESYCGKCPSGSAGQTALTTPEDSAPLVGKSVASTLGCRRPRIDTNPSFTDCRWRTLNVSVTDNEFTFTPSRVGNGCSASNGCGFNAIFSIYGSTAPYNGWAVPTNISDNQNNHFADNSYDGPWLFMAATQEDVVTQANWTTGFIDTRGGADIYFDAQDVGSTFSG